MLKSKGTGVLSIPMPGIRLLEEQREAFDAYNRAVYAVSLDIRAKVLQVLEAKDIKPGCLVKGFTCPGRAACGRLVTVDIYHPLEKRTRDDYGVHFVIDIERTKKTPKNGDMALPLRRVTVSCRQLGNLQPVEED